MSAVTVAVMHGLLSDDPLGSDSRQKWHSHESGRLIGKHGISLNQYVRELDRVCEASRKLREEWEATRAAPSPSMRPVRNITGQDMNKPRATWVRLFPNGPGWWRVGCIHQSAVRHGHGATVEEAYRDWEWRQFGMGRFA